MNESLNSISVDHPERPMYQSNLGNALRERFQVRQPHLWTDLQNSMTLEDAVKSTPGGHPSRANHLINLSSALAIRYVAQTSLSLEDFDALVAALLPN